MAYNSIFKYILEEEANFKTARVPIADNWEWNMYEHIQKCLMAKNSKFTKGPDDNSRPYKNIMRPILNVAYRSEGFNVKDIEPYVDNPDEYYKSFLVRKYNPQWARKNNLDTCIDESVESYVDYGLTLLKKVNNTRPEVIKLPSLAFCDQTDILSGPIAIKHAFSIDQLLEQKWFKDKVDEAIVMSQATKASNTQDKERSKTPGKYIEVYEVHGIFPETWLNSDNEDDQYMEESNYIGQAHYVTFYENEQGEKQGITLFKGKEKKSIFKAIVRDEVYGRACGFSGIEELFQSQIWTNYSEIKIKDMLDAAALMLLQTNDESFATRNKTKNLVTGEILTVAEGKTLGQVNLTPQNIQAFNSAVEQWEQHARTTGSADDALLGKPATSGTPFQLEALNVQEGMGRHDDLRGKLATFWGEVYRDWILGFLVADMNGGKTFSETLSLDEMQQVAEQTVTNYVNELIINKLSTMKPGEVVDPAQFETIKTNLKASLLKGDSKRFMEIMKEEFSEIPVEVEMNIAGKQKNLSGMSDKLTNIFRTVIANPQILANPPIAKLFNQILESAGLDPLDFSGLTNAGAPTSSAPMPGAVPSPMNDMMNKMMGAGGGDNINQNK